MKEGGGLSLFDSSPFRYSATFAASAPTWTNVSRAGGAALRFDSAVGQQVDFLYAAVANILLVDPFAVAFWLYPIPTGSAFATVWSNSTVSGIWYRSLTRAIDWFELAVGGSHVSSLLLTENQWNHVVVIVNAGTIRFVINGALDPTVHATGGPASFLPDRMGNDPSAERLNGIVDGLMAWDRFAMRPDDARQLYLYPGDVILQGSIQRSSIAGKAAPATITTGTGGPGWFFPPSPLPIGVEPARRIGPPIYVSPGFLPGPGYDPALRRGRWDDRTIFDVFEF